MLAFRRAHYRRQGLLADAVPDRRSPVLGEGARVKRRIVKIHVQESPKHELVPVLIAERTIAAH
jgi:hypothetical protein